MGNLIATKELAKNYLDIALKYDEFKDFLLGSPIYELKVKDSYGNDVYSAMHVMEAIYDKYRENTVPNLDKLTYETMIEELKNYKYLPSILNIIENIEYQITAENTGKAPFEMNCVGLLEEFKNHIERNKSVYQLPIPDIGENGYWPSLENHNAIIEQISGKKII